MHSSMYGLVKCVLHIINQLIRQQLRKCSFKYNTILNICFKCDFHKGFNELMVVNVIT